MADTLYRVCDLCGQVDDHPRHVLQGVVEDEYVADESLRSQVEESIGELLNSNKIGVADALRIGRDFNDTTSQDRHKDCCAEAGCPTGTCGPQVEAAKGAKGEALRKSILKNAED